MRARHKWLARNGLRASPRCGSAVIGNLTSPEARELPERVDLHAVDHEGSMPHRAHNSRQVAPSLAARHRLTRCAQTE